MAELDRRNFLKVAGLSAGAVATAACKEPVEAVVPYLNQPEEIVPGIPTYYASACRECPLACGIQVKTREGRPLKVDGNPLDSLQQGKLCLRGQAGLRRTYDAHRFRGPQRRASGGALEPLGWDEALGEVAAELGPAAQSGRVAFLGGLETGTLGALIDQFLARLGSSRRTVFELYAYEPLRQANQQLFGLPSVPRFEFGRADVVVAFGTDFLETWLDPVQNQLGFSDGRLGGEGFSAFVGPRLSLSGANCDLWLAPRPGTEILIALGLAREVARQRQADLGALGASLTPYTLERVAEDTGVELESLRVLARRVSESDALLALPPGVELHGPNATGFAAAVQLLNFAAGAVGNTVVFGPDYNLRDLARYQDLLALRDQLAAGEIDLLFVHQANPVYAIPGFREALENTTVVSFSSADDETTSLARWVLPDHTPFESWGDAQPVLGVRRIQQPTVNPLFDTRSVGDVLIDLAARVDRPLEGGDLRARIAEGWGAGWDEALAQGGDVSLQPATSVTLAAGADQVEMAPFEPVGAGEVVLVAYPSLNLYDGRSARIAQLQEIPDPVTKLVWGSYAEMHPDTADALGLSEGDVVRVASDRGEIELPAFPHEGLRPGVVAVQIGQGHQAVAPQAPEPDRHGRRRQIGVNVLNILPERLDDASGALALFGNQVRVESTGRTALLPRTQPTFDQEGRGIAQSTVLAGRRGRAGQEEAPGGEPLSAVAQAPEGHGESHGGGHHDDAPYADALHLETKPFDPADDALDPDYRWGMSIDLDSCTGCGACVSACIVENNIPTIGETLVRQGREMHWIRIERYVEHGEGGEIEVRHAPMLCQHCGAAPCESVCPVYATYHSQEGLNVMVPNRCIGTRYCGNNCPYKVRRFNYFPYDFEYQDPENLGLNPDVMVRTKGVMEKCTFCVQRIKSARDTARLEGRPRVEDGEVVPACAQTCPSNAIVFGNFKDPDSELSRMQSDPRAYWVFHHLNTRPAVTYQKSIERRLEGDV